MKRRRFNLDIVQTVVERKTIDSSTKNKRTVHRKWVVLIDLNQLLTRPALFFSSYSLTVRRNLTPTTSSRTRMNRKSTERKKRLSDSYVGEFGMQ